jgi:hypothetical protein
MERRGVEEEGEVKEEEEEGSQDTLLNLVGNLDTTMLRRQSTEREEEGRGGSIIREERGTQGGDRGG